jgi:hypothetical protein
MVIFTKQSRRTIDSIEFWVYSKSFGRFVKSIETRNTLYILPFTEYTEKKSTQKE